jgi:hypothetical protein
MTSLLSIALISFLNRGEELLEARRRTPKEFPRHGRQTATGTQRFSAQCSM